jgi:phosphohistidine phosphatase
MDLLLWRHAEAEDGFPDAERELTPRGVKQAKRMARWLRKHLPDDVRILVSPTVRTQQTANALGLPFETSSAVGTGASAADILAAAGWPDGGGNPNSTVLVVGHQPTLGEVAALLLTGREADWTIKKGAVWWFDSRGMGGEHQAVLRAVMAPGLA